VAGATHTNYNPLRHPISSLSVGDAGWTQATTFLITGILMLALAFGLRRIPRIREGTTWGPLLIGAVGIGLFGAGIFITDPGLDRHTHHFESKLIYERLTCQHVYSQPK